MDHNKADYPKDTSIIGRRFRLEVETANHRAIVFGLGGVDKNWFSPRRFNNAKKMVSIYLNRDFFIGVSQAARIVSDPKVSAQLRSLHAAAIVCVNRVRTKNKELDFEPDMSPADPLPNHAVITMLHKPEHALRQAVGNACDIEKKLAVNLHKLHTFLLDLMHELIPALHLEYLTNPEDSLNVDHLKIAHPKTPTTPAVPEWTPVMSPEYIAHRRAEREQWHKDHPEVYEKWKDK